MRERREKEAAKRAREEMDDEVIVHDGAFMPDVHVEDDTEDDGETE